jgi:hypothetical protein
MNSVIELFYRKTIGIDIFSYCADTESNYQL